MKISFRLLHNPGVLMINILLILALVCGWVIQVRAAPDVLVQPPNMNGWVFLRESGATSAGSLVFGPGTAPLGSGSARLVVADSASRMLLGTPAFNGVRLDQVTGLSYSTYRSSADAGSNLALALQFNIDYDLTDLETGWQGRLVYEPYLTYPAGVLEDTWQTWDALQGKWWSSAAPYSAQCSMAAPCTWAQVLANWPQAGINNVGGMVLFKAGGGWSNFDGNVDNFTIGVEGVDQVFDFEPPALVYVDDDWASAEPNSDPDGSGPAASFGMDAFAKVQDGVDALVPGGEVRVFPGIYSETAANRLLFNGTGPYQFGLFVGQAKNGLTIRGVDASNNPITDSTAVAATINTNATNNFGPSGFWIEGDGVTIAGVRVGTNTTGQNKTIEVIGDGFSLLDSEIADPQGAVYFNDWRFDTGTNTSHLQSYTIQGNRFADGLSLAIASGAGFSGPVSGRVILDNRFINSYDWPSISFSGSDTGVPWFEHSVGGALIQGNTFINTHSQGQHIRARGTYDNNQFDWASYWNDNTFSKAAVVGPNPPANLTVYSYPNSYGVFNHVRRIGASIQGEIGHAQAGDTVLAAAGTYVEQVEITQTLTLQGAGPNTIIQSPNTLTKFFSTPANNFPIVYIHDADGVTVHSLTVDGDGKGSANYRFIGIGFNNAGGTIDAVSVINVGDTPFSGSQHGVGIYAFNSDGAVRTIQVLDSAVTGFQKTGIALNSNASTPLVVNVEGSTVTGAGVTTITAQNGIQISSLLGSGTVSQNTISGIAYGGASWVATSLLNFNADLEITANHISQAQVGIYNIDGAAQITGNTLEIIKAGSYGYGIIATDPPEAVPAPFDTPETTRSEADANGPTAPDEADAVLAVDVHNNQVSFSGPDHSDTYGIEAESGYGVDDLSVALNHNQVSGFAVGVGFYQCTSSCSTGIFTAATAFGNSLAGNDLAMESNLSNLRVDASGNWWGSADPANLPAALGGDIDYTPWLESGADLDLDIGFQPDLSTVWVDDDSPQTGSAGRISEGLGLIPADGTVKIAAGTYPESISLSQPATLAGQGNITLQGSLALALGTFNAPAGLFSLTGDFTRTGGTFNPNGGTIELSGATAQTLSGSPELTFNNLMIANPAVVDLASPAAVNGTLTLQGVLRLGNYNLTLGPAASATGAYDTAAMVAADGSGAFCKRFDSPGSFTYPVGDLTSGADYSPALLDFTSGTFSTGSACVRVTDALHPQMSRPDYLTRYWTVTTSGITSLNAVAGFIYTDSDIVGSESSLAAMKYENPGTWLFDWRYMADPVNNRLSLPVGSFSDFTAGTLLSVFMPTMYR